MDIILSLTLLLGMRGGGGASSRIKIRVFGSLWGWGAKLIPTYFFDNGVVYDRIGSANKMLNYQNTKGLANHQLWIPFHFLPVNLGFF
ncbi:hypothetical protein AKG74_19135 [Vibrio parahaemolyticus]|uniref:DUF6765 family protein n=1 Tax=Vibrio parahaemolyticus TaxID=670 RepID=UPI000B6E5F5A|nr:hypothetical protein AKG74_19135 [Vibrio parahaemolyticus]